MGTHYIYVVPFAPIMEMLLKVTAGRGLAIGVSDVVYVDEVDVFLYSRLGSQL